MIAKVVLLLSAMAAARATGLLGSGLVAPGLLNSGVLAPGLLNSGIVAPGLLNSGIVAPGLLNSGIVAPGLIGSGIVAPGLGVKGAPLMSAALVPSAVRTSSVVAIPGAISTDKRVIGTSGLVAGSPLLLNNGIVGNGLIGVSPIALGSGIVSPLGLRSGIVSPIGLKGAGILAAPGMIQTILK